MAISLFCIQCCHTCIHWKCSGLDIFMLSNKGMQPFHGEGLIKWDVNSWSKFCYARAYVTFTGLLRTIYDMCAVNCELSVHGQLDNMPFSVAHTTITYYHWWLFDEFWAPVIVLTQFYLFVGRVSLCFGPFLCGFFCSILFLPFPELRGKVARCGR